MNTSFKIGDIQIGQREAPLVIPEIGINHEGSLKVAKLMVDAAYRAGARIVKHQTHIVEDEMSAAAKKVIPGNSTDSIYDIMARCALSEQEEYELNEIGVSAFKIGSGEMNNYPLLKHVVSFGKPMIVSTGMNGMESIAKAVQILEQGHVPYALLHTTNLYPTDPRLVRLGAMQEMMDRFPGAPVGLSDHTTTNTACIAAMALGACIVERHFTDTRERTGPDLVCSMDERELGELLGAARDVKQMLGGKKEAAKEEQVTIDFAFATVVSIKPIKEGEVFTRENLWVKRPGTGEISAEAYEELLGKHAGCDIEKDAALSRKMVRESMKS